MKIIENIVSRLKGAPYLIDKDISTMSYLFILIQRAVMLFRGALTIPFLGKTGAFLFRGKKVSLRGGKKINLDEA